MHRLRIKVVWHGYTRKRQRLSLNQENAVDIYFMGGSPSNSQFQNYCFVFSTREDRILHIKSACATTALRYYQHSIAVLVGESELIKAVNVKEFLENS